MIRLTPLELTWTAVPFWPWIEIAHGMVTVYTASSAVAVTLCVFPKITVGVLNAT